MANADWQPKSKAREPKRREICVFISDSTAHRVCGTGKQLAQTGRTVEQIGDSDRQPESVVRASDLADSVARRSGRSNSWLPHGLRAGGCPPPLPAALLMPFVPKPI